MVKLLVFIDICIARKLQNKTILCKILISLTINFFLTTTSHNKLSKVDLTDSRINVLTSNTPMFFKRAVKKRANIYWSH